jgi:hypothetical protein
MIFQRTFEGNAVVHHPNNGLAIDVAVTLMQVDGRTDSQDILRRRPSHPGIFDDLYRAGLIAPVRKDTAPDHEKTQPLATLNATFARAAQNSETAQTAPASLSMNDLKVKTAQLLAHALGPAADRLSLELERAGTLNRLGEQIGLARTVLRQHGKLEVIAEIDDLLASFSNARASC